jgi:hypothetical protein
MKKLLGLFAVLFLFGLPTFAQDKIEIGAGYAFRSFDQEIAPPSFRINMNGFDVNAAYNLNSWLGIAGDIVGTYANQGNNGDNTIYTFMGGPRVYPVGHHRIAPYLQAEIGGSHYVLTFPASQQIPELTQRGFAWSAGGGVDIFVGRHLGFKGQAEFEQTRFYQNINFLTPGGGYPPLQKNFVLVVGPVIRF